MNGNQVPLISSLKDKIQFSNTVKTGKFFNAGIFHARYLKFSEGSSWHIGIVCPKKIIKLSTKRNKIRRRVKNAFREAIINGTKCKSGSIVIFVKSQYKEISYQSILLNLKSLDL